MDVAVALVLILIVALIWRGPRTLPQIAAMLGRGVRQARRDLGASRSGQADPDERS
jgi:Sec-independent protein translocase protein TatA